MITFVIAGDKNFKYFVDTAIEHIKGVGYQVLVYDLGNLGYGKSFIGRYGSKEGAKIPCKPHIIRDALNDIDDDQYLVWFDADALIFDRIDEIQTEYDIGVTVRQPKQVENTNPINAGIVFIKKNKRSIKFIDQWIELSDKDISDQPPLNQLAKVVCADRGNTVSRDGVKIKVFPCEIYNNFYFAKKDKPGIKIKH